MFTIQIGARVRVKDNKFGGSGLTGNPVGTVAALYEGGSVEYVGVMFDEKVIGGHDMSGAGPNFPVFPDGRCRWGNENDLEVIGEVIWPLPLYYQTWPGQGKSGRFTPEMKPVTDLCPPDEEEEDEPEPEPEEEEYDEDPEYEEEQEDEE